MMDIALYESGNGGDISIKAGDIEMTDGLLNQPYLAHFGGNTEAVTTGQEIEGEERFDWWGNSFLEPKTQMNSLLEKSLTENALNSSGRAKIEADSKADLQALSELGNTSSVVEIIGNDKVKIYDRIEQLKVDFIWNATNNELIEEIII